MDDADFLMRALELAKRGEGHTRPNPPVGAVIVKNGRIVGEGWHRKAGGDHAEVAAIKSALKKISTSAVRLRSSPSPLEGSSLYVTLEPCSKPGRVGACTDAIIAAGIKKVIYAVPDPNPKNRGKARRALAKHGIVCGLADASLDAVHRCAELIRAFKKHVTTGLPFVTVKLAMSLDGKICDNFGQARWISCEASRKITGRLRETVDAIMVGAETVRRDNPSLLSHGKRNDDLIRVVVTHSGRLPKNAQIFTDGAPNETRVFRVDSVISGSKDPANTNGPTDIKVSTDSKDPIDAKDLKDVLRQLGKMGVMHVLCEGGLGLATALAEAELVDEWVTVLAPIVIGKNKVEKAVRGFAPTFTTWPGMTDNLCIFEKGYDWRKNRRWISRGGLLCLPE